MSHKNQLKLVALSSAFGPRDLSCRLHENDTNCENNNSLLPSHFPCDFADSYGSVAVLPSLVLRLVHNASIVLHHFLKKPTEISEVC